MPIGVPKVAYRLPGEAVPQWVDLYNRLYRERVLFLGSALDDELANQLNGIMLYLSAEDSNRRLFLYINSPGGVISSGLAIYDTMQFIAPEVSTLCIGQAASMGSLLLAGGAKGKRFALTNSRIMIHQPLGGFQGQASDFEIHAKEMLLVKQKVNEILSKHTGKTLKKIEQDTDRDNFLNAKEAKTYGIIDEILESRPTSNGK